MRNLSDILNPAPRSEVLEQSTDREIQPADHRKGHARFGSLSSPLHALALAAEEYGTPPMNSPTSPHAPGASFPRSDHRCDSLSSSGPGASQYVPPQLPLSSPTNAGHPEKMPPPRSDQTQPQSNQGVARRLSDIADGHAIHLPPLYLSSGEDREFAIPGHPIESYSIFSHAGASRLAKQEVKGGMEVQMTSFDAIDNGATAPSPVASPPPIQHPHSVEPQKEPEVKTEFVGIPPTVMNIPSPAPTGEMSSPRLVAQGLCINSIKPNPKSPQLTPPPTQAAGALLYPPQQPLHITHLKKPSASAKTEKKVDKKGTASLVKKTSRGKTDPKSKDGTPLSQRSLTPASSRASKTPAPGGGRKQTPTTPLHSSPPPSVGAGHEVDDDDANSELFCICRKPDDHTWMIACDGPCEDWFHGRCVSMDEEKGKLIDKYFCPSCSANGIGETTWKRMCRLPGCGRPVRVSKSSSSKYCSDEHGKKFLRRKIAPGDRSNSEEDGYPHKKKKKMSRNSIPNHVPQPKLISSVNSNNEDEGDQNMSDEDGLDSDYDQSHLRGGLLRPAELKALAQSAPSLADFHRLGTPVLADGNAVDSITKQINASNTFSPSSSSHPYTLSDKSQLEHLALQRATLKRKRTILDSKEKFLEQVRSRAKAVLEDLKAKDKSLKDICGYDSRLSWADEGFEAWKESLEGITMLETPATEPPKTGEAIGTETGNTNESDGPKLVASHGAIANTTATEMQEMQTESMCTKKRCERHRQWYKIFTQEIAFEKDSCRGEMRRVAKDERALLERAKIRLLENGGVTDKEEVEGRITEVDGGISKEMEVTNSTKIT